MDEMGGLDYFNNEAPLGNAESWLILKMSKGRQLLWPTLHAGTVTRMQFLEETKSRASPLLLHDLENVYDTII